MASTETRLQRGTRFGREVQAGTLHELRSAMSAAGLSQASVAAQLKISQPVMSRFLNGERSMTIMHLSRAASLLGLRPSLRLYPLGEPLRDAGQLKLVARFVALLAPSWHVTLEAPFPTLGDLRSWDALIRLGTTFRVGVEAETRVRDQQEVVRRIRQRELHGGVDAILLLLSDSGHNRALAGDLRTALGAHYSAQPRSLRHALRVGLPLPGSGLVLL